MEEPHLLINRIRDEVVKWRKAGWQGVNRITGRLLDHWSGMQSEPRLFFCQREAVETVVWLLEAGPKLRGTEFEHIKKQLHEVNSDRNKDIARVAIKMATGSGKTIVMALLIAWQALSCKRKNFLIITPNLTVKERLAELNSSSKLYADLLPPDLRKKMGQVKVTIINFQACQKRDQLSVAGKGDKATGSAKALLRRRGKKDPESWRENDRQMLDRLLKSHRKGGKITVINDEAHHCYAPTRKISVQKDRATRDEKEYEESAALWFGMLRSLTNTKQLGTVFDLSATPMYLRKPADLKSIIFPWTVGDYPLIEAVEAGITKIPRIPIEDDTDNAYPVYRNLYKETGQKKLRLDSMPSQVTTLLDQMHVHYRDTIRPLYAKSGVNPVFIVVANTVENATTLYQHIAGYKDENDVWHEGAYNSFSNVNPDKTGPLLKAPTLIVHSSYDSPDEITSKVNSIVRQQKEIHTPSTKSNTAAIGKIREMFNSIGQIGKPGEYIRCVISVSMLTEGWDAKNVTHIVGYRAFNSQLLCEQVCGRALRRTSIEPNPESGKLDPEYANIYGVPFEFMRASTEVSVQSPVKPYLVRTVRRRAKYRITFPNLAAYAIEHPETECHLDPNKVETFPGYVSSQIPTVTAVKWFTGKGDITELRQMRRQEIIYKIAGAAASMFADSLENLMKRRRGLFTCMLKAVKAWLDHPKVSCDDLRKLLFSPFGDNVPKLIAEACVDDSGLDLRKLPVFADERDAALSRSIDTANVEFLTTVNPVHTCKRSELNKAPCDSKPEIRVAQILDKHPAIVGWARNFRLGWQIPYLDMRSGNWHSYHPDFVARIGDSSNPAHLVIEYKGVTGEDSDTKTRYVNDWWLPAVINSDDDSCRGKWRYVFIDKKEDILAMLNREIFQL